MWTRLGLALGVLLSGVAPAFADGFVETSGTYAEGAQLRGDRFDTGGNLKTTLGTRLAGEDQTATQLNTSGVMVTEHRYSYSGPKTADVQIKGSAGFLHAITCNSDAAATAGSLDIYDSLTEANTKIHSITFGTGFYPPTTMIFDVVFSTGLYLGFTTTADVTCTVSYR